VGLNFPLGHRGKTLSPLLPSPISHTLTACSVKDFQALLPKADADGWPQQRDPVNFYSRMAQSWVHPCVFSGKGK